MQLVKKDIRDECNCLNFDREIISITEDDNSPFIYKNETNGSYKIEKEIRGIKNKINFKNAWGLRTLFYAFRKDHFLNVVDKELDEDYFKYLNEIVIENGFFLDGKQQYESWVKVKTYRKKIILTWENWGYLYPPGCLVR